MSRGSNLFHAIGGVAARRFVWVIVAWLVAAGVLFAVAPKIGSVVSHDPSAFLTEDAPSLAAAEVLSEAFPDDDLGESAAVVFARTPKLQDSDWSYLQSLESWLATDQAPGVVRGTASARSRPETASIVTSPNGAATIMLVQFTTPPFEPPTNSAVEQIRRRIADTKPGGLGVYVSGNAGVAADEALGINSSVERTTWITLVLVILILLWVYRSPVTPLVPLITIGIALFASQGIIALLAQAGMRVSSLVETFMVVIIFGAGTDYCLFLISRFREDVARSHEYRRTLVGTLAVVGAVIASSASTVIVGFTAQGVAKFGMFRTTGPAMAIAVLVTLVAGLTLTPALMRAFGRTLFWPAHPERLAAEGAIPELLIGLPETPAVDAPADAEPAAASEAAASPDRRATRVRRRRGEAQA